MADTLRAWVDKYGVRRALYVDWKNVYHHETTARQKQEGNRTGLAVRAHVREAGYPVNWRKFAASEASSETGPRHASGPLIKKMRLQKIASYEAANRFGSTRIYHQNRDIFIEAKQGTFLTRFDNSGSRSLTYA